MTLSGRNRTLVPPSAAERGQPFGKRSKERMSELVAGQDVMVDWNKKD